MTCPDSISVCHQTRRGTRGTHLISKNRRAKSHTAFVGTNIRSHCQRLWSSWKVHPLTSVGGLDIGLPLVTRISRIDMKAVEHVLAKLRQLLPLDSLYVPDGQ